jgi:pimeloyl-ACP methyl ester carboxylesterase
MSVALEGGDSGDLIAALDVRDDGTVVLDPALVVPAFYGDCDPADVERAVSLLRPHPLACFAQPARGIAWREHPTTYVVCGADRGLPPTFQRAMAARIPDAAVVEWAGASHSPFLSRPSDVVDLLAGLA